jgi:ribonuclease D
MVLSLVQDPTSLADLCRRLAGATWVALDTEFTRESTYYARLGLLQLATDDILTCVDPLAVDVRPLLDVLDSPDMTKVLHAARQDLEVLYDMRKRVLTPVFDTQIAAALLGFPDQVGYGTLVESVTGVKLAKLHTRTDWERRPLTSEQLRYAEDDVRYLRDVYHKLARDLVERNRYAWLIEECQALTEPKLYENDPATSYVRLKPGRPLAPVAQARLQMLAAWRESTAQRLNRPRGWIVSDLALIETARRAPQELQALERIPDLSPKQIAAHGDEILELLARTPVPLAAPLWNEPLPLTPEEQRLTRLMLDHIDSVAKASGLQPGVIGGRRAVQALIRDRAGALAKGWRWELVGSDLVKMLQPARS